MEIPTSTIIHFLSLVLPFANEIAIILTKSGLPAFHNLYSSCFDETIMGDLQISKDMKKKICRNRDYRNKIIIDLIAYLGITLFIGKNTLLYGYATGVATSMVLIFCTVILPNKFLGLALHKITKWFHIDNPYLFILIGFLLIFILIGVTVFFEIIAQKLTKNIKIDPLAEEHTLS
jgi:hypothetical protein